MAYSRIFAEVDKDIPKMNERVTRGLAYYQVPDAPVWVEQVIRCAAPGFPEGFRFERLERCTPAEAYAYASAKRGNKQKFEFSKSDVYLTRLIFSWEGEELRPAHLYLPYVREGGLITIMGSSFCISPVLSDKAISVGSEYLFIPMNRDRLNFKRKRHPFTRGVERIMGNVVWSNVYHASKKTPAEKPTTRQVMNLDASLVHYLFCKYGLTHSFQKYAHARVEVGFVEDMTLDKYPEDIWYLCSTSGVRPYKVRDPYYAPTRVMLAVRKSEYNETVENMIASFFYVADHFPTQMMPEYMDDTRLWKVVLGHVIYSSDEAVGKLLNKIDAHIASLDDYVDGMIRNTLLSVGVYVDNIYDLFAHINESFTRRMMESSQSMASMYGKRLMIMRYLLIDINKAVFGMMYSLQNISKKKPLNKQEITKHINSYLSPTLIQQINYNHPEVTSIMTPGDCMAFKLTANIVLQGSNGGSGKGGNSRVVLDATRLLDVSYAEVGQYNILPGGEPTGRNRISPYVHVDEEWTVIHNPDLKELTARTEERIRR